MNTQTVIAPNKTLAKYIAIINSGIIEESQVISMRSFMGKSKENATAIFEALGDNSLAITDEQSLKGYNSLIDQWKTPTGTERKNNPFGYREQAVLENFNHIELKSYYDAGNAYVNNYLPLYEVVAKDGNTFEYYYNGKVNITG